LAGGKELKDLPSRHLTRAGDGTGEKDNKTIKVLTQTKTRGVKTFEKIPDKEQGRGK